MHMAGLGPVPARNGIIVLLCYKMFMGKGITLASGIVKVR